MKNAIVYVYIKKKNQINKGDINMNNYINLLKDIKTFLENNKISSAKEVFLKFGIDIYQNNICVVCIFPKAIESILDSRFSIYEFYGDYNISHDLLNDALRLDVYLKHSGSLEIRYIHAGKQKRYGRGTFALLVLEKYIIKELNIRIHSYNSSIESNNFRISPISELYGFMNPLSKDTTLDALKKFYTTNGFELDKIYFYRKLKFA